MFGLLALTTSHQKKFSPLCCFTTISQARAQLSLVVTPATIELVGPTHRLASLDTVSACELSLANSSVERVSNLHLSLFYVCVGHLAVQTCIVNLFYVYAGPLAAQTCIVNLFYVYAGPLAVSNLHLFYIYAGPLAVSNLHLSLFYVCVGHLAVSNSNRRSFFLHLYKSGHLSKLILIMIPNIRRGRQLTTLSPGRNVVSSPVIAPSIQPRTYAPSPQVPTITPTLSASIHKSPVRYQSNHVPAIPTVTPRLGTSPDPLGPLSRGSSRSASPGSPLLGNLTSGSAGLPSPHFTPVATPRLSRSQSMTKLPSLDVGSILDDIKTSRPHTPRTPGSEHVTPRLSSARLTATPSPDDFRKLVTQELEKVKTERDRVERTEHRSHSKERRLTMDDPIPEIKRKTDIPTRSVTPPAGPTIVPPIKTVQSSPFSRRSQHLVPRRQESSTESKPETKSPKLEIPKPVTPHPEPPAIIAKLIASVEESSKLKEESSKPKEESSKPRADASKVESTPTSGTVVTPKLSQHSKLPVTELDLESIHSGGLEALEASLIAANILPTTPPLTPKAKQTPIANTVTPVIRSKRTLIERIEAEVAATPKTPKAPTTLAATPKTPKTTTLAATPKTPRTPKALKPTSTLTLCTFTEDTPVSTSQTTEVAEKTQLSIGADFNEAELKERLRNFAPVHPNDYHLMQDGDVITYINKKGKVVYDAIIRGNRTTKNKGNPIWIVEFPGMKMFRYPMLYTNVQKLWKRVRIDTAVLAKCVDITNDDTTDIIEYLTLKFGQEFTDYIDYKRSLRAPPMRPGDPVTKPGDPTTPIPPPERPPTYKSPARPRSPKRPKSPARPKSPKRPKSPARPKSPKRPKSPRKAKSAKNQNAGPIVNVTEGDIF